VIVNQILRLMRSLYPRRPDFLYFAKPSVILTNNIILLGTSRAKAYTFMESNTSSTCLFPPLDDGEEGHDVISPELKSKFDKLRALLPSSEEPNSTRTPPVVSNGKRKRKQVQQTSTDDDEVEPPKKLSSRDERSEKESRVQLERLELATETYDAIENEMSLMCNGIRELEALLERSSGNNDVLQYVDKLSR